MKHYLFLKSEFIEITSIEKLAFVNIPEVLLITLASFIPSGISKISTSEIYFCKTKLISSCSVRMVLRKL